MCHKQGKYRLLQALHPEERRDNQRHEARDTTRGINLNFLSYNIRVILGPGTVPPVGRGNSREILYPPLFHVNLLCDFHQPIKIISLITPVAFPVTARVGLNPFSSAPPATFSSGSSSTGFLLTRVILTWRVRKCSATTSPHTSVGFPDDLPTLADAKLVRDRQTDPVTGRKRQLDNPVDSSSANHTCAMQSGHRHSANRHAGRSGSSMRFRAYHRKLVRWATDEADFPPLRQVRAHISKQIIKGRQLGDPKHVQVCPLDVSISAVTQTCPASHSGSHSSVVGISQPRWV